MSGFAALKYFNFYAPNLNIPVYPRYPRLQRYISQPQSIEDNGERAHTHYHTGDHRI